MARQAPSHPGNDHADYLYEVAMGRDGNGNYYLPLDERKACLSRASALGHKQATAAFIVLCPQLTIRVEQKEPRSPASNPANGFARDRYSSISDRPNAQINNLTTDSERGIAKPVPMAPPIIKHRIATVPSCWTRVLEKAYRHEEFRQLTGAILLACFALIRDGSGTSDKVSIRDIEALFIDYDNEALCGITICCQFFAYNLELCDLWHHVTSIAGDNTPATDNNISGISFLPPYNKGLDSMETLEAIQNVTCNIFSVDYKF